MQEVSAAYAAQLERGEQAPCYQVTADWAKNGQPVEVWADSISVTRSITTDLPAEATLISGVSTATATLSLTGDPTDNARTAGHLYSPYQPDSPLYGVDVEDAPVTVRLGQTVDRIPELLTVLPGRARDLTVAAASDGTSGSLQVVDNRGDFRFTPTLPLIVANDVANGIQPGLNSQWVADAVFRQGGYYASPPAGPATGADISKQILSVPMHGSAAVDATQGLPATLLSASTASGGPLEFVPCKFGLGTRPDPTDGAAGDAVYALPTAITSFTAGFYAEMWIVPSAVSHPTGDIVIQDDVFTAGTRIRIGHNGANYMLRLADTTTITGPAVTGPTVPHYLAVWGYINGGSITVKWRVDGTTTTSTPVASPLTAGTGVYRLEINTYNTVEALQLIDYTAYGMAALDPPWRDAYVPTAVIEPGENELTAMPPVSSGDDGWAILQALASAEAAMVLLDETGTPQFWSRRHWGTATSATDVQRTLKATVPLKSATVQRLSARIRNIIRVPYTPVTISAPQVIWVLSASDADLIKIGPGGTEIRTADVSPAQLYRVVTTTGVIPTGGAMTNGLSGYRAIRASGPNLGVEVGNLLMTVTATTNSLRILFYNPNSYEVWVVSPAVGYPAASAGKPAAAVVGQLITTGKTALDTTDPVPPSKTGVEQLWQPSIDVYGERPLELAETPWRQTAAAATALAFGILTETAWPVPQLDSVTILADPALQLGDRVELDDDSGQTGIRREPYWVVGKTDRFTGGKTPSVTQDLTLRPVAAPGQMILGVTGRSELGGPDTNL